MAKTLKKASMLLKLQKFIVRKMSNMSLSTALEMFEELNPGKVTVVYENYIDNSNYIVTDEDPRFLKYPLGWFFTGCFFASIYDSKIKRVYMLTSEGRQWSEITHYHIA